MFVGEEEGIEFFTVSYSLPIFHDFVVIEYRHQLLIYEISESLRYLNLWITGLSYSHQEVQILAPIDVSFEAFKSVEPRGTNKC